jgi:hypothetical protein
MGGKVPCISERRLRRPDDGKKRTGMRDVRRLPFPLPARNREMHEICACTVRDSDIQRSPDIRPVSDETKNFGEFEGQFQAVLPDVEEIEWYYIPTRYSVSTRGEVYIREFSKNEAGRIYQITSAFVELSRDFIEHRIGKPMPGDRKSLVEMLTRDYADVIKRS